MNHMSKGKKAVADTLTSRTKRWTAEEKLRVVAAAASLDEGELGILLRREGLHAADIARFRAAALEGLTPARTSVVSADKQRIAQLERELHRKDRALAEAAAILVLRKKVQALWEGEGDDTTRLSGR
jgi:transposase